MLGGLCERAGLADIYQSLVLDMNVLLDEGDQAWRGARLLARLMSKVLGFSCYGSRRISRCHAGAVAPAVAARGVDRRRVLHAEHGGAAIATMMVSACLRPGESLVSGGIIVVVCSYTHARARRAGQDQLVRRLGVPGLELYEVGRQPPPRGNNKPILALRYCPSVAHHT